MPDQTPHTEMCSCSSTTVIRIHSSGSYCGDTQLERLADALAPLLDRDIKELGEPDVEQAASEVLDALRKEPAPAAIGLRKELEWLRDKLTSMVDAATEYSWVRVADQMEAADQQPAGEPEPCVITDVAGDTVRVTSLLGPRRIAVDTTDTTWLTPDQADQLADALRAHASARRADAQRSADV